MAPRAALMMMAILLTACGVEQARPAPVADADRWGHLPPDPQRPQQAARADQDTGAGRS